jgi:UDP-N-acetylmuramoyl-tripeptide--D-alanyl-D-alanine ligase
MITLTLSTIAEITHGELIGNNISIESISTDSRALKPEQLFLALKGPNFDGHRFIEQAVACGCKAIIVDKAQNVNVSQVVVADTRIALGKIGAWVKQQVAPKTVGITGSSGKTTVKEMVAAILSRLGNVLATKGNFNNDIGVPLTLLRLEPTHDFAVIEMGANHIGEIAYTTALVKPDVAIINNIAAAHLEGFGDLIGVARAKGEIFEGLSSEGVALYNEDAKYASKWQFRLTDKKVRKFSCFKASDCYSSDVILDENGCASFRLNTYAGSALIELTVPGRHNVCNAVAAAAVALEFGATMDDIRIGLGQMQPVQGRLNIIQVNENIRLIDDTYNANVDSIKAGIELLASYPGRRMLILGDMAELGENARQFHQEIGEFAAEQGLDDLLTLGVLSQSSADAFDTNGQHFTSRELLVNEVENLLNDELRHVSILVKGSRSAHMENVVADIEKLYQQHQNFSSASTTKEQG